MKKKKLFRYAGKIWLKILFRFYNLLNLFLCTNGHLWDLEEKG